MRKIISRVLSVAAAAVLLLTAMPALSDNAEKAPEIPGINDALMEINPSPYIGLGSITDNPFSDSDDSLNESLRFNIQLHSGNPNLSESIPLTISRNRDSEVSLYEGQA
ncbi:MAG: hypothetical protein PHI27_11010 [Eubacteriales bacterium]|nr:hypothetical protein [Eubacteriales bacterium]MDD4512967.1 hypothetical protein [Eubacteriales bacterium]